MTKAALLVVLVLGCGSVTAKESADAAAGAGGQLAATGGAGGMVAAGGTGGGLGGRGDPFGSGGQASTGGATGAGGHPSEVACPTPIYPWGTRCPPYPDGTYCVLGCIYDNSGSTYDPPTGACYAATTDQGQGSAICVSRSVPSCSYCP